MSAIIDVKIKIDEQTIKTILVGWNSFELLQTHSKFIKLRKSNKPSVLKLFWFFHHCDAIIVIKI